MAVHTSRSMHCRRRYGDPELAGLLFTYFGSPSKFGGSPSFLRVTGRAAYRRIGPYETSMTTVRTWELVHRLRRNSRITFHTWGRPPTPYSIGNIWTPPLSVDGSPLFLSHFGWDKSGSCVGELVWIVGFQGFELFLL